MDEKVNIGANAFLYPMPMVLVGTKVKGRANFMAVAWAARVNGNPPIMAVALNQRHYTPVGIRECQTFSMNIPNADLMARTDYCGLVSGRSLPSHYLFLGEVVATYADKDCLTDGKPDVQKLNPFVLTVPDNNYWTIGQHAGKAWSIGQEFKR
jgi:flavin reductase (DIM6/NTAB) family NADH-FMN oxidoreductase RutF